MQSQPQRADFEQTGHSTLIISVSWAAVKTTWLQAVRATASPASGSPRDLEYANFNRSVLGSMGVAFPSAPSTPGPWDVLYYALSKVGRESVLICLRMRPRLLAVLWGRKKGLGTRVILCLHWFQRLFTCKCFCNFPSPFQQIYSEIKRFAQWWLQERTAKLGAAKVRKWNTCLLPKQFFFSSDQWSGQQGKGPSTGPDASSVVRK